MQLYQRQHNRKREGVVCPPWVQPACLCSTSFKAIPQPKSPPVFCPWLSHSPWELTSSRLPFPHISGLNFKRVSVEAKCSPVQKCKYRMDQTSLLLFVWVQAETQQKLRELLTLEGFRMPVSVKSAPLIWLCLQQAVRGSEAQSPHKQCSVILTW